MNDKQFATQLMIIIGALIGLTVVILALANVLISDADYSEDVVVQGHIEERIKPIGMVAVAGETASVVDASSDAGSVTNVAANSVLTGEQVYTQACSACHEAGILNAPKLGDQISWGPRIDKGVEQLHAGAINGIGAMPPKGGRADLSDDDIKKGVDYMLESVQ